MSSQTRVRDPRVGFHAELVKLANELGPREHKALLFLFKDKVRRSQDVHNPQKFLEYLSQSGLISQENLLLLRYTLIVIGRIDLSKRILGYYQETKIPVVDLPKGCLVSSDVKGMNHFEKVEKSKFTNAELKVLQGLEMFLTREKLYDIVMEYDNQTDLQLAKYWLQSKLLSRARAEKIKDWLDLLEIFEQRTWEESFDIFKELVHDVMKPQLGNVSEEDQRLVYLQQHLLPHTSTERQSNSVEEDGPPSDDKDVLPQWLKDALPKKMKCTMLNTLPVQDINSYIQHRGTVRENVIGEGGSAHVFKGNRPYHGKNVVIKVYKQPQTKQQYNKDKVLAFIKHTSLLPLFGISEHSGKEKEELLLMYPLMDGGDLNHKYKDLLAENRLRILTQVVSGISFLHTPVPGVRNSIVHGDIKPENIFLDAMGNARLGDTGVATEMLNGKNAATMETSHIGTLAFLDPDSPDVRHRMTCTDMFSFGVVALMLLSNRDASVSDQSGSQYMVKDKKVFLHKQLRDKHDEEVKSKSGNERTLADIVQQEYVCEVSWKHLGQCVKRLSSITASCLSIPENRPKAADVLDQLQKLCSQRQVTPYVQKIGNTTCLLCMINDTDVKLHALGCTRNCQYFCKHCLTMAHTNPLVCPTHGNVQPPIGHKNCYALLMLGKDKNPNYNESLKHDYKQMLSTITDRRIMGIRSKNIQNAFNLKDLQLSLKKIAQSIAEVKETDQDLPSFLFVYFTGHSNNNNEFSLELNSGENLPAADLKKGLTGVGATQLVVILDCCYATKCDILPDLPHNHGREKHISALLASSSSDEASRMMHKRGSRFSHYVIAGLRSETPCPADSNCQDCIDFKKHTATNCLIHIAQLQDFVREHVKKDTGEKQTPDETLRCNASAVIAYSTEYACHCIQVMQSNRESGRVHVDLTAAYSLNKIRQQISQNFKDQCKPENICLYTVSHRGNEEEIDKSTKLRDLLQKGRPVLARVPSQVSTD